MLHSHFALWKGKVCLFRLVMIYHPELRNKAMKFVVSWIVIIAIVSFVAYVIGSIIVSYVM